MASLDRAGTDHARPGAISMNRCCRARCDVGVKVSAQPSHHAAGDREARLRCHYSIAGDCRPDRYRTSPPLCDMVRTGSLLSDTNDGIRWESQGSVESVVWSSDGLPPEARVPTMAEA